MKKLFFLLLVTQISFVQMSTLPNPIGINFSTVSLPINSIVEIARFQETTSSITFYNNTLLSRYIQIINNTWQKNNHNITAYTRFNARTGLYLSVSDNARTSAEPLSIIKITNFQSL